MSTPEGVDLPVVAHLVSWMSGGEELVQAHASDLSGQARLHGVELVPLADHAAALSRIRSLQQEVERLSQQLASMTADAERWAADANRLEDLVDSTHDALRQEVERLRAGIGEVAMRLSKDKGYRLRAAEALLALLPDSGPNVAPGGHPSEMSK